LLGGPLARTYEAVAIHRRSETPMNTRIRCVLAKTFLLVALAAAGAPAGAQTSEVPYKALMDTARAHAVVAAFDHSSFGGAAAIYPRDANGATMRVRTGNYMLWKIVHLFASDRRVERIALPVFRQVCTLKKLRYARNVACRLNARIAVTHRGQTNNFNIVVSRNVGRFVAPKPGEDMSVIHSGVAATIDDAVTGVAAQLRRMGAL